MAARKFHQRPEFLYLGGDHQRINPVDAEGFEMNESDVWHTGVDNHSSKEPSPNPMISRRSSKFPLKARQQRKASTAAKSLPVNVPDWSKILRDEYVTHHGRRENNDYDHYDVAGNVDGDGDDDDDMLPPHEYLARTRIASFSVHEGIGRTLKGRDLSRVRNAIWKQTGFEQD